MVCIYCGGKTHVTNSRPQKRLNRTWRRRECAGCGAIFTTEEAAELTTSLSVRHATGELRPFKRDELFASVLRAVGHRTTHVEDAGALTDTIIAKLLHSTAKAVVTPAEIVTLTHETLRRFDTAAAVQYQAYHR